MIPMETLAAFFMASVLLGLAPGPDNIFVLTQSALRGRTAGLLVTLGLCTGLVVHTTAVAFGVAVVFQASRWRLRRSSWAVRLPALPGMARLPRIRGRKSSGRETEPSYLELYRRGIIMNVTNPKVSIFFWLSYPNSPTRTAGR